jgi:cellulose synthase/poly-beta-1,6-N-acetylglucosamine synthase-like glycosyltransferase
MNSAASSPLNGRRAHRGGRRIRAGRAVRSAHGERRQTLDWNKWIRQIHRWLAIVFTATVILNVAMLGQGEPAIWIGLLALLPLVLLLVTGLYMFVLPHALRWRSSG